MFVLMKYRTSLKVGHVGSKTGSNLRIKFRKAQGHHGHLVIFCTRNQKKLVENQGTNDA